MKSKSVRNRQKITAKNRRTSNSILLKKNVFFKYIFHEQPLHKKLSERCYAFPRNSFEPFRIPKKKDENEQKKKLNDIVYVHPLL